MNPVIIIPTYISARRRKEGSNLLTTYDHTTSLNQPGELSRCLNSLQKVQDVGQIIILVASEPSIEVQSAEKVRALAAQFPDLNILVIEASLHALIQQRMEQLGLGTMAKEVGLSSYGAIRNLGLVAANILGFDSVVFIDDDEIIEDPAFLHNALYGLGKLTKKGIPILAKTGFYFNARGNYFSQSQDKWYNHFWQQGKAFNKWIQKAMKGPRLSRSNHVCGGCLALHKEAFKRLGFDPWIPRGEDLDYLLNLRMYGSDIWFDNQWSLVHKPPATPSEGVRFRQDIYRWIYELRKMEYSRTQIDLLQVRPSSLEPYPGPFLEPGIEGRIWRTAFLRSLARPDKKAYRKAAKAATGEAVTYAQRNCSNYFEFQYVWPEMMARLEDDKTLQPILQRSLVPKEGIDPGLTSEIRLNIDE
ncbi:MAG: hypothetical protein LBG81_03525 [Coriobacteriaceae bacterium]|nr:hypothetical protein [Coriobacteriaceae bacterium]